MSELRSFWDLVNEALDERRDPLDDAEVRRLVACDPKRLDAVRLLGTRLTALPARAAARAAPAGRRLARIAAAAAVLTGLVATAWWPTSGAPDATRQSASPGPAGAPRTPLAAPPADDAAPRPRLAVLRFEAQSVVESAQRRTVRHLDRARVRTQRITTWSHRSNPLHADAPFSFTTRLDARETQR